MTVLYSKAVISYGYLVQCFVAYTGLERQYDVDAVHDQHLALHQVVSIWLLGEMLCGCARPTSGVAPSSFDMATW